MGTRLELHHDLCEVLGCPETGKDCRVYFQPTVNTQLKYPCILYEWNTADTNFADNAPYRWTKRYQVTVIDKNPDTKIPELIAQWPLCLFDRFYTADNLNHYVLNLYY